MSIIKEASSEANSLIGYENNNINNKQYKMRKQQPGVADSPSDAGPSNVRIHQSRAPRQRNDRICGRAHLNSLWSVWYGLLGTILQAYAASKCARRFLQYVGLPWTEAKTPPIQEFHACLLITGIAVLLLPLFIVSAVFKVGNNANDGVKLGRGLSTCTRDPGSSLFEAGGGGSGLWRHGGPTAPFLHMVTALCLLLPKLLMEARLIEAGFLPQDAIWRTDLDFMVLHRDRLVVLNFMANPSLNSSILNTALPFVTTTIPPMETIITQTEYSNITSVPAPKSLPFSMVKTIRDLLGSDNSLSNGSPDIGWGSTVSVEYLNYVFALFVYSIRYAAVFWSTNKCFGTLFSFQMLVNSVQNLLAYAGMSVLYKIQVVGIWKALPLLRHHTANVSLFGGQSPFLLNPLAILGLFLLSGLVVLSSSLVLYLYGYGRFNAFLNHERNRRLVILKGSGSAGWGYFTHCAALCVLLAVAVCNGPLLHDYMVIYKGSLDGTVLACIIGGILHLFLWIVLWLFLTVKQKWVFKLRVTVGRATVRSARSVKLVTDLDLVSSHKTKDTSAQPLLVIGNGRTYTIDDLSPKKSIMSVIQQAALQRKAKNGQVSVDDVDGEEQIYWLRPITRSPATTPEKVGKNGWFNKHKGGTPKHKVTFNDTPSTSLSRNKGGLSKLRPGGGGGEIDDGDYATLRELPLIPTLVDPGDDSTSEEGKLLACMQDESITYASTSKDLVPPLDYEDPSPLLTPEPLSDRDEPDGSAAPITKQVASTVSIHQPPQQNGGNRTPRLLRRTDSGMPQDELTHRSDSVSTHSSTSPPEVQGSTYSESSSGVHSNTSSEVPHGSQVSKRTASIIDLAPNQWTGSPSKIPAHFSPSSTHQSIYGFSSPQASNKSIISEHGIPAVLLEGSTENTVVIRRKPTSTVVSETLKTSIIEEDPYGRSTNMRLTSFMETNDALKNVTASSATLPHYPTQPVPVSSAYPHCSTMPLPQHTSDSIPSVPLGSGTSYNAFPRPHTTIPTQLNGIKLFPVINANPHVKRFPTYLQHTALHARLANAESIYGQSGKPTQMYNNCSS